MDRRRYFISLLFRMSLVVLALMLAVRASYVFEGSLKAWCLAGLFGLSAAALQIRPLLVGIVVLIAQLLLRSVAIRLERGEESPHWGAFQPQAVTEAIFCLALSVPISVLARIHVALLAVVYLYVGLTWWFMDRFRKHLRAVSQETVGTEDQRRWVA